MTYRHKGQIVCISLSLKNDELLILSADGERCLEVYKRPRVELMQKEVVQISAFKPVGLDKKGRGKLVFEDLYFVYNED